ncbi:Fungal specific transcription factor domain-containing protein [Cladophialophora immunda]|nr:Fungal specific transcription factor domain-containing protein [Cladophialophora immunda]
MRGYEAESRMSPAQFFCQTCPHNYISCRLIQVPDSGDCEPMAKKACIRCSTQKRRCDKVIPVCGLCRRLHQRCEYDTSRGSLPVPTVSPSECSETAHTPAASDTSLFTADSVKNAIVHRLGSLTLEDSLSTYHREIEPWFPIISTTSLHNRLTQTCNTWGEVPLDIALLCISIILVATPPSASPENEHCLSDFKSTYCQVKTWISSTEVLGLNSPQIAQARVLATLFEVAHGLYPAAYISIGATVNAADALTLHPGAAPRSPHSTGDENNWKREESALIWCGILILDRYITVESGSHPSLTRSRFQALQDLLEPVLRLTHSQQQQDEPDISSRLTRLVEATTLLDKIHAILNSPTAEHQIDVEELILTVQTVINFQTEIDKEVGDQACAHVSGLGPCNT